jgi:outer membrane protein assembly factor BamB
MTALLAFLLAASFQEKDVVAAPGHWPQFRGPDRDGVSGERDLLREWPAEGPPLLWKAAGLGEGIGCVSVAGGFLFAQGNEADKDVVKAFDGRGRVLWAATLGPASGERSLMRYVTQRSPTVADGLLFVTTWQGMLSCLDASNGRILWRKEYARDFGARTPPWAFGDAPFVDGPRLLCAPGGANGSLAALNKSDGALVWRSAELKDILHAAVVPAVIDGFRQYIAFTYETVAGVSPEDGKVLWRIARPGRTAVVTAPIVHDGVVFVSSGFGVGCNAFRVSRADGKFSVQEIYAGRQLENNHGGIVRRGDYLYGTDNASLKCVELKTGRIVWTDRSVGKGAVTLADDLLICRSERGPVALVEATPEGYRERGRFVQPDRTADFAHTHPVVAGGRLYLRDQNSLYCYDLRGPDYKPSRPVWDLFARRDGKPVPPGLPPAEGKAPDAAFVPTPQDVVEKMLEAAQLSPADVLYDLGSGDGRIPVTASKLSGCASFGVEIDPDLVRASRKRSAEAKVDLKVTWVQKDLFTTDFSGATVVTLYLGATNNARLLPKLRALKPGARIVSHEHLLGPEGPPPDRTIRMVSSEDHSEHTFHLWATPLKGS